MENIFDNLKTLKKIMSVWIIAIFFSSLMFTLGLIYEIKIVVILACITGILSIIGTLYSGYIIIRLENQSSYLKHKVESIEKDMI